VRGFAYVLETILATAIAPNGPSAADRQAAEILEKVWFTSIIGWATGVNTDEHISTIMRRASLRVLKTG
jgi:hypothetical protein